MNKKVFILVLSTAIITLFSSGIIRHDINEEEYTKLASGKQFDAVGQVYIDTSSVGSSVLISEKFVLSAAHVFIESDTRLDTVTHEGQTIVVHQPINERLVDISKVSILVKGQKLNIKKITLHPNYLDSVSAGSCDLAILELEIPFNKVKHAHLNWDTDEKNSSVVGVGFGVSGIADKPETVTPLNKKIAGQNVIDSIGGFEYFGKSTLLFADFDHPTRVDCNKLGSSKPEPLEYICGGGDSGGGLFRKKNNRWELIGICSGSPIDFQQLMATGYYGQIMSWTRISAFKEWILDNTK